ncbi:DUF1972 domain-containing protein [bacterium SCSIO 12741]|nr:DUF1972 domain-containing protein [bacterium SCSIO 12741]
MKKIAIIGTAGVPARYGGFETLADNLVDQLGDRFEMSVYCSNRYYSKSERTKYYKKARLYHLPLNANGLQSIPYDIISILHALIFADTLIILGVSGCIVLPFVKLFSRKRIIVNIDGLEWKRGKWSKPIRAFLKFSEYLAVRFSDADITDNESIKRYTGRYYKTLSHLIEYGGNHARSRRINKADRAKYSFLQQFYAFTVCRIEPENNIHVLLETFKSQPDKPYVIVGNWENSPYGQELKAKYSSYSHLHLLDPIYDQKELDKLRSNCYVYVHGHSAGGTNPSLVEAMYLGLPIIAFDVSYNRATTEGKAFYFENSDDLTQVLKEKRIADYTKNGKTMKRIAKDRYEWSEIAGKYARLIFGFDYNYQKKSIFSSTRSLEPQLLIKTGKAHLLNQRLFFDDDEY